MTDETGARNSRTVVDVADRRCRVRACVDACRQGNGSRVTAWRTQTQPSAASVSRSLLRAPSLSLSLPFPPSHLLSLARSRSRAPGSRPGRDRFERSRRPSSARPRPDAERAPLAPSLSLSPTHQLFSLSLSLFLPSSRAEYIHIRAVHFSLYPVSFLGPHSLTFGLLRFRLDRARVRRIVASSSHRIAARASRRARLST